MPTSYDGTAVADRLRKNHPFLKDYSDKEIIQSLYRTGNAKIKDIDPNAWQFSGEETTKQAKFDEEFSDFRYGGFGSQFSAGVEQFVVSTPQTFGGAGLASGQFLSDIGLEAIGEGMKNLARPVEEWGNELLEEYIANDTDLQGKLNWAASHPLDEVSDILNPGVLGRITSSVATSLTAMFLPSGGAGKIATGMKIGAFASKLISGTTSAVKLASATQRFSTFASVATASASMFVLESGEQFQNAKDTYQEHPELVEAIRQELIESGSSNIDLDVKRTIEQLSARSAYIYGSIASVLETLVPWGAGLLGRPAGKAFGQTVYSKIAKSLINGVPMEKAIAEAVESTTKMYSAGFKAMGFGKSARRFIGTSLAESTTEQMQFVAQELINEGVIKKTEYESFDELVEMLGHIARDSEFWESGAGGILGGGSMQIAGGVSNNRKISRIAGSLNQNTEDAINVAIEDLRKNSDANITEEQIDVIKEQLKPIFKKQIIGDIIESSKNTAFGERLLKKIGGEIGLDQAEGKGEGEVISASAAETTTSTAPETTTETVDTDAKIPTVNSSVDELKKFASANDIDIGIENTRPKIWNKIKFSDAYSNLVDNEDIVDDSGVVTPTSVVGKGKSKIARSNKSFTAKIQTETKATSEEPSTRSEDDPDINAISEDEILNHPAYNMSQVNNNSVAPNISGDNVSTNIDPTDKQLAGVATLGGLGNLKSQKSQVVGGGKVEGKGVEGSKPQDQGIRASIGRVESYLKGEKDSNSFTIKDLKTFSDSKGFTWIKGRRTKATRIKDVKRNLAKQGESVSQPTETIKTSKDKVNIYAGAGQNTHLSNFAHRPFKDSAGYVDGTFNTVEGAFQAAKLLYSEHQIGGFNVKPNLDEEGEIIRRYLEKATGSQAKSLGRNIKGLNVTEWNKESEEIMGSLIYDSFNQNPNAKQKLLNTGNATLTHTQDKSKWGKLFPKLLMEARELLGESFDNTVVAKKNKIVGDKFSSFDEPVELGKGTNTTKAKSSDIAKIRKVETVAGILKKLGYNMTTYMKIVAPRSAVNPVLYKSANGDILVTEKKRAIGEILVNEKQKGLRTESLLIAPSDGTPFVVHSVNSINNVDTQLKKYGFGESFDDFLTGLNVKDKAESKDLSNAESGFEGDPGAQLEDDNIVVETIPDEEFIDDRGIYLQKADNLSKIQQQELIDEVLRLQESDESVLETTTGKEIVKDYGRLKKSGNNYSLYSIEEKRSFNFKTDLAHAIRFYRQFTGLRDIIIKASENLNSEIKPSKITTNDVGGNIKAIYEGDSKDDSLKDFSIDETTNKELFVPLELTTKPIGSPMDQSEGHGICDGTCGLMANRLKDADMPVGTTQIDDKYANYHAVALTKINGEVYILNQPQLEFISREYQKAPIWERAEFWRNQNTRFNRHLDVLNNLVYGLGIPVEKFLTGETIDSDVGPISPLFKNIKTVKKIQIEPLAGSGITGSGVLKTATLISDNSVSIRWKELDGDKYSEFIDLESTKDGEELPVWSNDKFTPRLIKATKQNLIKEYNLTNKQATASLKSILNAKISGGVEHSIDNFSHFGRSSIKQFDIKYWMNEFAPGLFGAGFYFLKKGKGFFSPETLYSDTQTNNIKTEVKIDTSNFATKKELDSFLKKEIVNIKANNIKFTKEIKEELTNWYKKTFPEEYKSFQSGKTIIDGYKYKSFVNYIKTEGAFVGLLITKKVMGMGYSGIINGNEAVVYNKNVIKIQKSAEFSKGKGQIDPQTQQVLAELKRIFPNITVKEIEQIMTEDGRFAFGMALDGAVTLSKNARPEDVPHEYLHIYIKLLAEHNIVKLGMKRYTQPGDTVKQARERLVQAAAKQYIEGRKDNTKKGNLLRQWLKSFWNVLHKLFNTKKGIAIKLSDMLRSGAYTDIMDTDIYDEADVVSPEYSKDDPITKGSDSDNTVVQDFTGMFVDIFNGHSISPKDYKEVVDIAENVYKTALKNDKTSDAYFNFKVGFFDKAERMGLSDKLDATIKGKDAEKWENHLKRFFVTTNSKVRVYQEEEQDGDIGSSRLIWNAIVRFGTFRGLKLSSRKNIISGNKNPNSKFSNFIEDKRRIASLLKKQFGIKFDLISLNEVAELIIPKDVNKERFYKDGNLEFSDKVARSINERFLNDFNASKERNENRKEGEPIEKPLLRFLFGAKGSDSSALLVGYVPKTIHSLDKDGVIAEFQSDLDAGLITKEHFNNWMSWVNSKVEGDHHRGLAIHRYWQQLRAKNYLLKHHTVHDMFNRLRMTFAEGLNFIGSGKTKMMLVAKSEIRMTLDGKTWNLNYKDDDFDGTLWISRSAIDQESDIIGNVPIDGTNQHRVGVSKTALEQSDETGYLGIKALEREAVPNIMFWKGDTLIAYADANGELFQGGSVVNGVAQGGTFIHRLASNNEAKQFYGKFDRSTEFGGLEQEDGFYKIHDIDELSVKSVIAASTQSKSHTSGQVAFAQASYFPGNSWKNFEKSVKKYFTEVANEYLPKMFEGMINPEVLMKSYLNTVNLDKMHGELADYLRQNDPNLLELPGMRKLLISHIKKALLTDGVNKAKSLKGMSTQLWNGASIGTNLKSGEFAIGIDNSTIVNFLVKMHDRRYSEKIAGLPKEIIVQELNGMLKEMAEAGRPFNMVLDKPPNEGRQSVGVYNLKEILSDVVGDIIFVNKSDAVNKFHLDFDGDKTIAVNVSSNLKKAYIDLANDKEYSKSIKDVAVEIFKKGEIAINSSMSSRDSFYDAINAIVIEKGSQGMATNWQTISKMMAQKELSFTVNIKGKDHTFTSYQPNDPVYMDYAPLTDKAVKDWKNGVGVIAKNGDIVKGQKEIYQIFDKNFTPTTQYAVQKNGTITGVKRVGLTKDQTDTPIVVAINSGGQTGADRGGLLAAQELGKKSGGVAPKGFITEAGADATLRDEFGLIELGASKLEFQKFISREDVRNNIDKIYLFGDNLIEKGFGGQAKEMRGEPNAIGIPTKKLPSMSSSSFFTDKEFEENKIAIDKAFAQIPKGKTIVIPKDGLGTGLASLKEKAPETFAHIRNKLTELKHGEVDPKIYPKRTRANVENTDGTVIFGNLESRGSKLTWGIADKLKKPLSLNPNPSALRQWLNENNIKTLNVAGNKESSSPGIQDKVKKTLISAMKPLEIDENTGNVKESLIGENINDVIVQLKAKGINYELVTEGANYLITTYENQTENIFNFAVDNKKLAQLSAINWSNNFRLRHWFKNTSYPWSKNEKNDKEIYKILGAIIRQFNYSPLKAGRGPNQKTLTMKDNFIESAKVWSMNNATNKEKIAYLEQFVTEDLEANKVHGVKIDFKMNDEIAPIEHLLSLLWAERMKHREALNNAGLVDFADDEYSPMMLSKKSYIGIHKAVMNNILNRLKVNGFIDLSGLDSITKEGYNEGIAFEKKLSKDFWKVHDTVSKDRTHYGDKEQTGFGILDTTHQVEFQKLVEDYYDEYNNLSEEGKFVYMFTFLSGSSKNGGNATNVLQYPPSPLIHMPTMKAYAKLFREQKENVMNIPLGDTTNYFKEISVELLKLSKMEKVCN